MLKVGITQGDINGIGPEVIIKALADSRMTEMFIPVIYGCGRVFSFYKKNIRNVENFSFEIIKSPVDARPKRINLIETCGGEVKIEPGVPSMEAGKRAAEALHAAVNDLRKGDIDVLVTAPINKENMQGEHFGFTGHTEFLASQFGGEPLMMMCSSLMKVALATIHVPLSEVTGIITKELIVKRLRQLRNTLKTDFRIVEPRIAVLSLNPHVGDGGLLGEEEIEVIKPAITEAAGEGVLAFGPFAADGFFAAGNFRRYDAVLAMYHDQGLTPFKMLSPDGVNFTAGLNVVRTSPDHGVAYDIANKDMADPDSMRGAIYMAMDIFGNRDWYADISKNPLRRYERERGADVSVRDLKLPDAANGDQ